MVRKYFVQQLGLLLMVSVIIILTNVIGYKMPVKDSIIGVLLLSAISLIGISLGKDLKDFAKMGWKLVLITLFVITGTFIFSALVADVVLKMTGAI